MMTTADRTRNWLDRRSLDSHRSSPLTTSTSTSNEVLDTTLLLQSAARSVLDAARSPSVGTPTADLSDDEDDDDDNNNKNDNNNHRHHTLRRRLYPSSTTTTPPPSQRRPTTQPPGEETNTTTQHRVDIHPLMSPPPHAAAQYNHLHPADTDVAALSSLETKRLPAMPDEQDRRRFIGCLAAVLASSYEYDTVETDSEDLVEETTMQQQLEHMALLESGLDDDHDLISRVAAVPQQYQCYDEPPEDDDNTPEQVLRQSVSGSFEYADQPKSNNNNNNTSKNSLRRPTPYSQELHKVRLSRSRHRKRRYDVLSKLLLSSAEYLQLEKSQAKAFLPMLSKLLVPNSNNNNHNNSHTSTISTHPKGANSSQPPNGAASKKVQPQRPPRWRRSSAHDNQSASTNSTSSLTAATPDSQHDHSFSNKSNGATQKFVDKLSQAPVVDEFCGSAAERLRQEMDDIDHLRPFVESMTPGGGFRCLALVLLQHLLQSPDGYDARVRHALKRLGVLLLVHDMEQDPFVQVETSSGHSNHQHSSSSSAVAHGRPSLLLLEASVLEGDPTLSSQPDLVTLATRRFESLEHWIAKKLLALSYEETARSQDPAAAASSSSSASRPPRHSDASVVTNTHNAPGMTMTRDQWLRSLKVGAVGVAAASLFAVTGGLAAPGIAAGVAAFAGGTAATAAAATLLTSTAALTTIFGVGGGTLVAYKMNRRTQGLTEFEFRKETGSHWTNQQNGEVTRDQFHSVEAALFSTIVMSGWLRDLCDFQRPWGVVPSNPWISDRAELLERFYAIHRPDNIAKSRKILKNWEGEEKELWNLLRQKYGADPDHLFPLPEKGPRKEGDLTLEQKEIVDQLFVELGYVSSPSQSTTSSNASTLDRLRGGWGKKKKTNNMTHSWSDGDGRDDGPLQQRHQSLSGVDLNDRHSDTSNPVFDPRTGTIRGVASTADASSVSSLGFESITMPVAAPPDPSSNETDENQEKALPKHIATVWDYQATFGGELYTVRWESDLLTELCDSVSDLAFDLVSGGTAQLLKHTALSTFFSAIAWPYALVNAANMIDGTWTLSVERSDAAGKELARSLLFSRAGHRPVTLVGFSFGARAIYACLKELARYQEKWCEYHEKYRDHPDHERVQHPNDANSAESEESYRHMREPASIVEDVILMGLPNHLSINSWKACRQVVAGRMVNCFSQKDLILSLMFQFKRLKLKPVCGTCPVIVDGVENIDVTDLISGHEQYCTMTGELLQRVRHGQPFRSRPTKKFRAVVEEEQETQLPDKFDV